METTTLIVDNVDRIETTFKDTTDALDERVIELDRKVVKEVYELNDKVE